MRDFDITKLTYKSFRSLKKRLGEFDAVVECNEIAIREFTKQVQESGDIKKYIQELSLKHRVRVDEVDFLKFASRIRQFYVLSVSQQGDQFLTEFEKEYKEYYPEKTWQKNTEKTVLYNVLMNVFGSEALAFHHLSEAVFQGFEYYRLIRNLVAHSENYKVSKITNQYNLTIGFQADLQEKYHLNGGLNAYTDINYDDFLMITNIVKNIGYCLCKHSTPSNQRVAEILVKLQNENGDIIIKGLSKLKNNEIRFENAVLSLLHTSFGRFSSTDKEEIVKNVKSLLA